MVAGLLLSDIVLVFRFKDEEDYVERFLRNNLSCCSCFIAMDDRSSSDSVLQKLYEHDKCAGVIRKTPKFTNYNEPCDREVLYSMAFTTGCKFALYLDLDEVVSRDMAEEIATLSTAYDVYRAPYIYMYPDDQHYVTEGIYAGRIHDIIFRLDPEQHASRGHTNKLHTKKLPCSNERRICVLNSPVYHFNMNSEERRERRVDFYKQYDKGGFELGLYRHLFAGVSYEPITPNIEL